MPKFLAGAALAAATVFATQSAAQNDLLRGAVEELGRKIIRESLQDDRSRQP